MKKNYIFGILAIIILVVGSIYFFSPSPSPTAPSQQSTKNGNASISVSLSIGGLYDTRQVTAQSGETVLSLLQRLNTADTNIKLGMKEYSGLGTLVENIGELRNGAGNKYWQYSVNDVMPQIGADKFLLSDGDQIRWSFSESAE